MHNERYYLGFAFANILIQGKSHTHMLIWYHCIIYVNQNNFTFVYCFGNSLHYYNVKIAVIKPLINVIIL